MSVLVDDAADSVVAAYPQALEFVGFGDRFGCPAQWCPLLQCLVRPVGVVMGLELAEGAT